MSLNSYEIDINSIGELSSQESINYHSYSQSSECADVSYNYNDPAGQLYAPIPYSSVNQFADNFANNPNCERQPSNTFVPSQNKESTAMSDFSQMSNTNYNSMYYNNVDCNANYNYYGSTGNSSSLVAYNFAGNAFEGSQSSVSSDKSINSSNCLYDRDNYNLEYKSTVSMATSSTSSKASSLSPVVVARKTNATILDQPSRPNYLNKTAFTIDNIIRPNKLTSNLKSLSNIAFKSLESRTNGKEDATANLDVTVNHASTPSINEDRSFKDNTHEMNIEGTNLTPSELDMKLMLKRERNRIAARKCRDKKLNKIKFYETRINKLENEIRVHEDDIVKLNARKNELRLMLINFCVSRMGSSGTL